jgi:hypothetical protein
MESGGGFLRQFRRSRLSNFVTVINKVYTTTPRQPHYRRGVNSLNTSLFVFTPLDGAVGVNYGLYTYKILWYVDQLLSNGSVNNGRC